ncbi:flagellar protein FlhE [Chimaeribacter arupi]|uniref:flagellar protein FlhE n=1 Tax=Chimaeribacter arupi TaxID=2060066 RepID=UPI000C7DAC3A|nr:flagellar protein FlhE [Chimaeribacter arupi]MDV5141578.1 flagellar protein FlhE [Chimaeribacter arupi]PLR29114.1 flagellar protein FlhE [Chimaeribacter arupi]
MRALLLTTLLTLLPAAGFASGTWSADSRGITLSLRNQALSTPALSPPVSAPVGRGLIATVNWRYRLLGPTPDGLRVQLCTLQRCTEINGQSGTTHGLGGEIANQPLRMIFSVAGKGVLNPPMRVVGQEIRVNYR